MVISILSHFFYGLFACFFGGLPLGIINMSVINISLKKSYKSALVFAAGSAIVEIFEASVAVIFGLGIEVFLRHHRELQLIIFVAFVVFGLYFLLKKSSKISYSSASRSNKNEFLRGMLMALLNPQAIPFWLFALAFVAPYHILDFVGNNLYYFLTGVFLGKLFSLFLFAKGASMLNGYVLNGNRTLDRVMGTVFILIGVIEVGKYYL